MIHIYIAGRYRHYHPDGSLDESRMALEMEDEIRWGSLLLDCFPNQVWPHLPLTHTVPMEDLGVEVDWIKGDLAHLSLYRRAHDAILMRPGYHALADGDARPTWYPGGSMQASDGACREHEQASCQDLRILYGCAGEANVIAALADWTEENRLYDDAV